MRFITLTGPMFIDIIIIERKKDEKKVEEKNSCNSNTICAKVIHKMCREIRFKLSDLSFFF